VGTVFGGNAWAGLRQEQWNGWALFVVGHAQAHAPHLMLILRRSPRGG
jgi:hypothetical protein